MWDYPERRPSGRCELDTAGDPIREISHQARTPSRCHVARSATRSAASSRGPRRPGARVAGPARRSLRVLDGLLLPA